MRLRVGFAWSIALVLIFAACGDSGPAIPTTSRGPSLTVPSTTTSTVPATSSTEAPDTTLAATGAIGSVGEARSGVVQIVAKGTFVDPFEGVQANVPGAGSGFIIDPSGLAVTNNHVVTGAALLEVFLDGEDEPRNARVVAVSECSDLAVIDIAGEGFPYFDWHSGGIEAGLAIFAAGFPLGNPEYTLLDGIVSKEDADGETSWASVDAVIEHSANTLPGNSGGPILSEDGAVVAVNYASNSAGQSFAIGREVAQPVVAMLAAGENVDSIGVNGEALFADGFSGVWAYSVASGAAADRAGVQPGDLITQIEDLDLGRDGTMAEYCDILRSHTADDTLSITVYRQSTDEVLEGQLNGRLLEAVFSFATELDDVVTPPPETGAAGYTDYYTVTDDTGAITASVPVEWSDTNGVQWEVGGALIGPALSAAPDLGGFSGTWGTPGVFIGASDQLAVTPAGLLDSEDFSSSCDFVERLPYDDGLYVGEFDVWENCGTAGSTFLVIGAEPPGGAFIVLVQMQIVEERDFGAADEVIRSFFVADDLGGLAGDGGSDPNVPLGLPSGLFCRDLADMGYWYGDAAAYWVREGRPNRMDADLNGIPCETVYDADQIDGFFFVWFVEPGGLFCRDLNANDWSYGDALAYWIFEGTPDRMDADLNGIPCETVYDPGEIDVFLFFEYS